MRLSKSAKAEGMFQSVNGSLEKHEISWANCIALGVVSTSVNIGKHKLLIVEFQSRKSQTE